MLNLQQTIEAWRTVFLIAGCIYAGGNVIFILFGSAAVQPWNETKEEKKERIAEEFGNVSATVGESEKQKH